MKTELLEARNKLYEALPTGKVDSFELLQSINKHLKRLDSIIDKLDGQCILSDVGNDKLLHELKSFRNQLSEHDSLIRAKEAIRQFFKKSDQEITIRLKADTCASEIIVYIDNFMYKELPGLDFNEIVRRAIENYEQQ